MGNIVTEALQLLAFIYIARELGVHDYGVFVTVGAFVGFFGVFLFGGLNKTLIRAGSKNISMMHEALEKTIALRQLLIVIAIVICIISSNVAPYSFTTKLYIMLVSIRLANTSLTSFIGTIYQATENLKYLAIFNIINKILYIGGAIFVLYFNYGLLGLFSSGLLTNFIMLFIRFKISRKFVRFNFFSKIHFDKNLIKQGITFSLIAFIGSLATRVDLLMISFLGSSEEVGIYAVAYKLASQGNMLRNVNAMAFFPIFVKKFQNSTIKGIRLIKWSTYLFIGIFTIAIILFYFIEDIVLILFGNDYRESGKILRILIFYHAFFWSSLPFTTALQATHNEKIALFINSLAAGINIPLNVIFFYNFGLIGIAYSTLVVYGITMPLMCVFTYVIMKKQGYLIK